MLIYIFLVLNIIVAFIWFVWQHQPYQLKVLAFGLAVALWVFSLYKTHTVPLLFQGFAYHYLLGGVLVLTCSKHAGKRAHTFLCSLLVRFGLHIVLIFPSLTI